MSIKHYTISVPVKRQLGKIIRTLRLIKCNEFKRENLIDINPYTKEKFCENNQICHYHTLTKLETDYVREDNVYHILLNKLGLKFQVKEEDHDEIIKKLDIIIVSLLDVIEKQNIDNIIKEKINLFDNYNNCIVSFIVEVLNFAYYCFLESRYENDLLIKIENYLPLYDGLYQALAYQAVGYCYFLKQDVNKAKSYCLKAIELYKPYEINIGITHFPLVDIYVQDNNYYDAVKICNQLEEYYFSTNNKRRLLSIYIHLADYYLLINSKDFADDYYNQAIFLANDEKTYSELIYKLHSNWGYHELSNYNNNEALKHYELAYKHCLKKENKLAIINRLLICLSLLNREINNWVKVGYEYVNYSNNLEYKIFKYFEYKTNGDNDFSEYAKTEIIPVLKTMRRFKIILLFFYEDVYNENY